MRPLRYGQLADTSPAGEHDGLPAERVLPRHGLRTKMLWWLVVLAFCVGTAVSSMVATRLAEWRHRPSPAASAALLTTLSAVPAPTFAEAAQSLRTGRHAEAYGRFVALADEGDVSAGRLALLMHRFGPSVFGSSWDASVDQLALWTKWSEAAADEELASLQAAQRGRGGARKGR